MIPAVGGVSATGLGLDYLWVAAGSNGELWTSTSTTVASGSWTSRTSSFGTTAIEGVASNGTSLYVAVGRNGKIATSPNGTTWTQQTSPFGTTDIWAVAYGNGYWVATGGSAKAAYSPDGTNWTLITGLGGVNYYTCAWGGGIWVIGTSGGDMYTATDPTGTWTARTPTVTSVIDALYFNKTTWVTGHDAGTTGALASSTNGTTWTSRDSAFSLALADINTFRLAANTSTVAILGQKGSNLVDIETSTNGTTWTDRTPAITTGNCLFGSSDGSLLVFNGIQTSTDGITWTSRTSPSANLICMCHSSGMPSLWA